MIISISEIQRQCNQWWLEILSAYILKKEFFPKDLIRIGKVSTKDVLSKFNEYTSQIKILKENSKESKNFGYQIEWTKTSFQRIGEQTIPTRIYFESLKDYLHFTNSEEEYKRFVQNYQLISTSIPELKEWTLYQITKVSEHKTWKESLLVCKYFLSNPEPNLYIRQLPIDVHTKYIQENKTILSSLLEFLLKDKCNQSEKQFEKKFHLKHQEPLIRIRFLDTKLSIAQNLSDVSVPLSEFHSLEILCKFILVVENLMNFLTLPNLPNTISIWSGGGFSISYLKKVQWLKNKQFYYWGDIDVHGFQILNQFRNYFSNTYSLMMDKNTLDKIWKDKITESPTTSVLDLPHLTDSEKILYEFIRENRIRLEQEKIPQDYAESQIRKALVS